MAEPTSASALIRASIEALPNWARSHHWKRHREFINTAGDWPLAECGPPSDGLNPALLAEHIVTLASPDVATALADLLDALRLPHEACYTGRDATINAARDALERAISKGEQP